MTMLLRRAYPLLQADSDLGCGEALLGELQVLLPAVQHVLVDRRPKLHLRAAPTFSLFTKHRNASCTLSPALHGMGTQLAARQIHSLCS